MAHNLALREDGQYAFVSAKEPAWHTLGTILTEAFTSEVALKQGGLDFDVIKLKNKMENDVFIPDSFSLVRTDRANDEKGSGILGICGKDYHIVQNSDLFSVFDFLVKEDQAIYETAGVLGKGERVWILARLPKDIVIGDYDAINQYILITNAHTGKNSAVVMVTPIRVVCNNTLNMALHGKSNMIKIKHFKNAEQKLQEAHKVLGFSTKYYDELSVTYNKMQNKKVTDTEVSNWVKKILDVETEGKQSTKKTNNVDEIMNLYQNGEGSQWTKGTLWGFVNAVTEYADFEKVVRGDDSRSSKRLNSIWFGTGAKLKQDAFDLAQKVLVA